MVKKKFHDNYLINKSPSSEAYMHLLIIALNSVVLAFLSTVKKTNHNTTTETNDVQSTIIQPRSCQLKQHLT